MSYRAILLRLFVSQDAENGGYMPIRPACVHVGCIRYRMHKQKEERKKQTNCTTTVAVLLVAGRFA